MRRRSLVLALVASLVLSVSAGASLLPAGSADRDPRLNRFAPSGVVSVDPRLAGMVGLQSHRDGPAVPPPNDSDSGGCPDHRGSNVRTNQDCTNQSVLPGRGQAQNEPSVAVNPRNPRNVVAAQNDYRRGDAGCGVSFSKDGGKHWGSRLAPMGFSTPGFGGAARHYWHANGDPSVAFDSQGTAYLFCLAFDRAAPTTELENGASGLFIMRSLDGGASWSFPPSAVKTSPGDGSDGIGLLDKPYMTADAHRSSPFADRVYAAWVEFSSDFSSAPVGFAWSDDAGATWNQSGLISGTSAELCPNSFSGAPAGTCDANQFPQPFVAPNGDVYVAFQNFNNAVEPGGDNHNQVLIVKSTDGGATFSAPVKVADFFDLPDCLTYTGFDAGRACVPTAPLSDASIFRATNYPVGVALRDNVIAVTFGSYINRNSNPQRGNCTPTGFSPVTGINTYDGVGVVNGCNNDIVLSVSIDGGQTFTGQFTPTASLPSVSDESRRGPLADQFWHWAAATPRGGLSVSYYDRKYGDDQSSGEMDITLRQSDGDHVRVTNRSMPPPNEFAGAGSASSTFFGDYAGLAIGSDGMAHPVWTDSRNPVFSPDPANPRQVINAGNGSDIYTRRLRG